jgi:ATP-dependent Clp protease ATP-binding subunit ClpA
MEKRLEDLIKEVQSHNNIILFIDEVHTIVHAGSGSEDGLDVSNILKPALSRGNLSVIGATTLREYERTIKKDQALDRRFEKVVVRPPSSKVMHKLTEKILAQHEEFHGVKYSEEFRNNLVEMCDIHMPNRNYPDKAIDVVDKCGAAAKIERFNISFEEDEGIEEFNRKLREFSDSPPPEVTLAHLAAHFNKKKNRLISTDEFSEFKDSLIFQKEAAAKIAAILKGEHMGIYSHGGRPISFSLFGKTGNGKTHFLKNLAKFCSSNGINVIQINGAEYNFHNAGYALTEVRRGISLCEKVLSTPNTVVIVDDAEKLGESAANTFAQALKDGRLNAENGEIVDFTDSIFFFCAAAQNKKTMGFEGGKEKGASTLDENLRKACVHSVEFSEVSEMELKEFVDERMAALRKALASSEIRIEGPKTAPKTLDEAVKLCEVTAPQKVQEALISGETTITV